jgi:hypothetical protein
MKGPVISTPTSVNTSYNIQLLRQYSSKDTQILKRRCVLSLDTPRCLVLQKFLNKARKFGVFEMAVFFKEDPEMTIP